MSLEQLTLSDEQVQDIVASLISSGDNADAVYDDTNDTLTVSLSDSISVNTLEASEMIDGAAVSHTGELADLADVSSIQSSSGVVVTDTQAGTVSDQEFLKNEGGNLTGATVQTEPNIPNWQEDGNSPFTFSGSASYQISLANEFDIWQFYVEFTETSSDAGPLEITGVNDSGGSFDYERNDGTLTTLTSTVPIAEFTAGSSEVGNIYAAGRNSSDLSFFNAPLFVQDVSNGSNFVSGPITCTKPAPLTDFSIQAPSAFDITIRAYGVDI